MAGSRYEYVKYFEGQDRLLPGCWGVIRLDGRGFTKFTKTHDFEKPNDIRALRLCNAAASKVLQVFDEHICFAYGQSDEYSFILRRESTLFSRRESKILSTVVSLFSASYVFLWPQYMNRPLVEIPSFDGRIVLYPTTKHLRDYLRWRQADVHINNLFNTTFWALVQKGQQSTTQAELTLKKTLAKDKHEILFSQFEINYNDELNMFRKGSFLVKASYINHDSTKHFQYTDIDGQNITNIFQEEELAAQEKGGTNDVKVNRTGANTVIVYHGDIIGDDFWINNPDLLGHSDLDPPRIRKS